MKVKRLIFLLFFFLIGCQLPIKETEKQENIGIYYPAVASPEYQRYQSGACYSGASLAYMNKIYTSTEIFQAESKWELPLHIIEKELVEVYGNHRVLWSTNNEALLSCTDEGYLYKITNYSEENLLALYYEVEHPTSQSGRMYNLIIFEQMNDIWLYEGKELYQERLHLDKAVSLSGLSAEEETVVEFINALMESEFIDPKTEGLKKWGTQEYQSIYFYDITGLTTELRIYNEGYVIYQTVGSGGFAYYILKLDEKLCAELLDKIK